MLLIKIHLCVALVLKKRAPLFVAEREFNNRARTRTPQKSEHCVLTESENGKNCVQFMKLEMAREAFLPSLIYIGVENEGAAHGAMI